MIIPIDQIEADTLENLVQAYVLQEGTDYGEQETPLPEKVQQVLEQLRNGDALILYSELHESVNIVSKQAYQAMLANPSETDYSG